MSEPCAEVLCGLVCDGFVFQPKEIVYNSYSGMIKPTKPKPRSLSSVLCPLRESKKNLFTRL